MIHAYASMWRRLVHDIIIEIREKGMCACVITLKKAHKSGNENNCKPLYREYMEGEEVVWGRKPPPPPPQKPTE